MVYATAVPSDLFEGLTTFQTMSDPAVEAAPPTDEDHSRTGLTVAIVAVSLVAAGLLLLIVGLVEQAFDYGH